MISGILPVPLTKRSPVSTHGHSLQKGRGGEFNHRRGTFRLASRFPSRRDSHTQILHRRGSVFLDSWCSVSVSPQSFRMCQSSQFRDTGMCLLLDSLRVWSVPPNPYPRSRVSKSTNPNSVFDNERIDNTEIIKVRVYGTGTL